MLPKDIVMLVSYLNTKLRDDDMSFSQLIEINGEDPEMIKEKLENAGYKLDETINQWKLR